MSTVKAVDKAIFLTSSFLSLRTLLLATAKSEDQAYAALVNGEPVAETLSKVPA